MSEKEVEPLIKICLWCKRMAQTMDKCKICKDKFRIKSYYCSKACQESDWPQHKLQHKTFMIELQRGDHIKPSTNQDRLTDINGSTPLMINTFHNNVSEVKKILESGDANVTAVDKLGLSVLDYALFRGRTEILNLVLASGADALLNKNTTYGFPYLLLVCHNADFFAKHSDFVEAVKLILKHSPSEDIFKTDKKGGTCLHVACEDGELEVASLFAEIGGKRLIFMVTPEGCTCLHVAIANRKTEIIKMLIRAGGDELVQFHHLGLTHLHTACEHGSAEALQLLLDVGGERLLARRSEEQGGTCLDVACHNGRLDAVRCILAAPSGPALIHNVTADGTSCLYAACMLGHAAIVRELLRAGGVKAARFAASPSGCTCLHVACNHGHTEVAQLLLAADGGGKELLLRTAANGATCLDMAAHAGHAALAQLLLREGGEELLARSKLVQALRR